MYVHCVYVTCPNIQTQSQSPTKMQTNTHTRTHTHTHTHTYRHTVEHAPCQNRHTHTVADVASSRFLFCSLPQSLWGVFWPLMRSCLMWADPYGSHRWPTPLPATHPSPPSLDDRCATLTRLSSNYPQANCWENGARSLWMGLVGLHTSFMLPVSAANVWFIFVARERESLALRCPLLHSLLWRYLKGRHITYACFISFAHSPGKS